MDDLDKKDKIPTNEDFLRHTYVASATECTGFAPAPIDTYTQAINYNAMYGIPLGPTPTIDKKKHKKDLKKNNFS